MENFFLIIFIKLKNKTIDLPLLYPNKLIKKIHFYDDQINAIKFEPIKLSWKLFKKKDSPSKK